MTVDHIERPDLVIADISSIDPEEVADSYPDIPILGYTNHTDTSGTARRERRGIRSGGGQVGSRRART